jgi:hypothetical protein
MNPDDGTGAMTPDQHDEYVKDVTRAGVRTRRREWEEAHPGRLAPCRKCNGERSPKLEVTVYTHPVFMPHIEQRVDAGYCIACAKREVEELYAKGIIKDDDVKGVPTDDENLL